MADDNKTTPVKATTSAKTDDEKNVKPNPDAADVAELDAEDKELPVAVSGTGFVEKDGEQFMTDIPKLVKDDLVVEKDDDKKDEDDK